jgi:hypothetical protein
MNEGREFIQNAVGAKRQDISSEKEEQKEPIVKGPEVEKEKKPDENAGGKAGKEGEENKSGEEKKGAAGGEQQQQQQPEHVEEQEEDPAVLLKKLQKINPNIKSLDDVKEVGTQAEDPEKLKKKRDNAKLKFALDNEKFTIEQYNSFQQDASKNTRQFLMEEFASHPSRKDWSQERIDKAFAKYWNEDVPEDADDVTKEISATRKSEMESEKERLLRKKYSSIYSLDKDFEAYEEDQRTQRDNAERTKATVKTYVDDVEKIIGETKSIKVKVRGEDGKEDEDFETDFVVSEKVLDEVKKNFLSRETASLFIGNYNADVVKESINTAVMQKVFHDSIGHVARLYASKRITDLKLGRKGMDTDHATGGTGETPEKHKASARAYDMVKDHLPV